MSKRSEENYDEAVKKPVEDFYDYLTSIEDNCFRLVIQDGNEESIIALLLDEQLVSMSKKIVEIEISRDGIKILKQPGSITS